MPVCVRFVQTFNFACLLLVYCLFYASFLFIINMLCLSLQV